MKLQELRPAHTSFAALRRRFQVMATEDIAHGDLVNDMPQVCQGPLDTAIPPRGILFRHADHELLDLLDRCRVDRVVVVGVVGQQVDRDRLALVGVRKVGVGHRRFGDRRHVDKHARRDRVGAPDVLGRKVSVNQYPMTIIGVAAPSFRGIDVGEVPLLWIPASMSAQAIPGFGNMLNRRVRWMQVLGRLNQGMTLHRAQTGLQPWFKAMLQEDTRRLGFPVIAAERRTPEYLAQFLAAEIKKWEGPIKASGISF